MNYAWQNATQPWETITQTMSTTRINEIIAQSNGQLEWGKPWKLLSKPYTHFLIVCGGGQAQAGQTISTGPGASAFQWEAAEIHLPSQAKWEALLKEAEKDLGPILAMPA